MYRVITADGAEYGPVDLATLGAWVSEGRVRADSSVVEVESGQRFLVADHPFLRSRLPVSAAAPVPVLGIHDHRMGGLARNNSGEGAGDVPQEARGFHWGALGFGMFGWGWIWAFSQRAHLLGAGLLGLYAAHLYANFATRGSDVGEWLRPVLSLAHIGVGIYLGVAGGRISWHHRRFADVGDFVACRRVWGWWALGLLLAFGLIAGGLIAFFVALDASRN